MGTTTETRISSTQAKDAIYKIHSVNSSASEIDSVANTINPLLAPIYKLFRESANGINTIVKYIVTGDSTRHGVSEMLNYYTRQLAKINVGLIPNAYTGQTAYDWLNNIDNNTINQAISAISGEGENTILEFSLGLNDYTQTGDYNIVKSRVRDCIVALLTAKPKLNIILVSPTGRNNGSEALIHRDNYLAIANEFNLIFIDGTIPTITVLYPSAYYFDTTHPSKFGGRRIVNYIFDKILPTELLSVVTLEEYDNLSSPPNETFTFTKISGKFYGSDNIVPGNFTNGRILSIIDVAPNYKITVTHRGNRDDVLFFKQDGTYISKNQVPRINYSKTVTIPLDCYKIGINLSNQGAVYDALNDTPIVEYYDTINDTYLSIKDINKDLKIRNIIDKYRNGILVDDYGMVGTSGQSLKIDSNGKMKWTL